MPEHLAAEALQRTKRPTYGSLSLFDFEPGQYECSMGIFPVVGLNARQQLLTLPLNSAAVSDVCHQPRVSFDPPGCGSGMRVPALPEPCCHHGAQGGRLPSSLGGFPAVPLQRLSMLLHKIDRQVTFTGIPAGPWLANTTAVSDAKRHGKRLRFLRAVILFVSFKILGYSILTGHSA